VLSSVTLKSVIGVLRLSIIAGMTWLALSTRLRGAQHRYSSHTGT